MFETINLWRETFVEMKRIDLLVFKTEELKLNQLNKRLDYVRTVQKYLNILGWRKIRSKFRQMA